MEILLVLPVLIPLFSAIIMIFLAGKPRTHRAVNFAGSLAQLIASIFLLGHVYISGIEVMFVGSWPAPYGITLVADMLSAVMVLISGIIGFVTSVYSLSAISPEKQKFFYFPLLQILLMGINGSFITGDIFNLFVWFEVMLISSFVLLALGGKQEQLEGAMKYVTLNLISSAIFLAAVGILFGIAGTLNMADLAVKIKTIENPGLINIVSMMFLISFGIKSAIFPLFFWLPASYHTPPSAVSAIFAGMLTKVGVYAMIRMFSLIFTHNVEFTHSIILILAGFTMVTGVFGAAAQNNFRRILSFHIISQIG
ncbi:MAG: proton-conducting transporter membrane subunit [Bacteroidota bacterium]